MRLLEVSNFCRGNWGNRTWKAIKVCSEVSSALCAVWPQMGSTNSCVRFFPQGQGLGAFKFLFWHSKGFALVLKKASRNYFGAKHVPRVPRNSHVEVSGECLSHLIVFEKLQTFEMTTPKLQAQTCSLKCNQDRNHPHVPMQPMNSDQSFWCKNGRQKNCPTNTNTGKRRRQQTHVRESDQESDHQIHAKLPKLFCLFGLHGGMVWFLPVRGNLVLASPTSQTHLIC